MGPRLAQLVDACLRSDVACFANGTRDRAVSEPMHTPIWSCRHRIQVQSQNDLSEEVLEHTLAYLPDLRIAVCSVTGLGFFLKRDRSI